MNERLNPASHNNGTGERGCERAEDLIAYLYGEAAPEESKSFRRHLTSCAVCREELAAFGGVREAVGEWRADVMSAVPALGIGETYKNADVRPLPERRRSASAALREFFSLSPLWLRVGAVAATLIVCALAALTLARTEVSWDANGLAFRTGVKERIVKEQIGVPSPSVYTQQQVDALVKESVEREVTIARASWKAENNQHADVVKAAGESRRSVARDSNGMTSTHQQSPRRATPGNAQRDQLARENENVFYPSEERVPRLTDLLGAVKTPNKANER